MQLTERHIIKRGHPFFKEIDALSFASKNLYNAANYVIRQNFIYGWGYLNYNRMADLMKSHEAYKSLPAKISQQILMVLDRNWKSFFEATKEYSDTNSKFKGRPSLPKYKDKKKGRNLLVYTIQAISKPGLKQGIIKLSGTSITFPSQVSPEQLCQVRIVPKCDSYVIEVIYAIEDFPQSASNKIASIDLGLNNLAALTSNLVGFVPILVNGRYLKSVNQFLNKRKSHLQSKLKGNRKTSSRIQRLTRCRNQKIDNYLHRATRFIVKTLVSQRIGTLVIGKNERWKDEIEMGKQNNQNFLSVPHSRFISMLSYKCSKAGIMVVIREESYTSKASFLDNDLIPTYGEETETPRFSGRRVKRGLYKTSSGTVYNADVNGSYNILRKAFPNAFKEKGIESCVVQPRRIVAL
jgi:putative transposase